MIDLPLLSALFVLFALALLASLTSVGFSTSQAHAQTMSPEDIVDTLATPDNPTSAKQSLLTEVCSRSVAVGALEGVSGARPYCTSDGVGSVLAVFPAVGTPTHAVSVNQASVTSPGGGTRRG